ncbi:MlaC/ttg2D family ABC transporter substrate-binding protein [Marinomonas sp. PE14-40]|uniref:MlaC/ttg2D family ABC transporter substrate-binding protein n=1 Tax=Marinomonas sp. PE14-40 TaxID=3060621 RepID=UPI003F668B81
MKTLMSVCVLLLSLVMQPVYAQLGPREQVVNVVELLKTEIVANREFLSKDKAALRQKADEILSPLINFDNFAKNVMGKYYRRASKAQRLEFSTVTKQTLLNSYATALLEFDEDKVKILPLSPSKKKNKARVNMEFVTDAGSLVDIVFLMKLSKQNEWLLDNVIISGINFGLTFRKQFASMVQKNKNNIDLAIASWAKSLEKRAE